MSGNAGSQPCCCARSCARSRRLAARTTSTTGCAIRSEARKRRTHTFTYGDGRQGHVSADCETEFFVIVGGLDTGASGDSLQQALFLGALTGKSPAVVIYDTDHRIGAYEHTVTGCQRAGGGVVSAPAPERRDGPRVAGHGLREVRRGIPPADEQSMPDAGGSPPPPGAGGPLSLPIGNARVVGAASRDRPSRRGRPCPWIAFMHPNERGSASPASSSPGTSTLFPCYPGCAPRYRRDISAGSTSSCPIPAELVPHALDILGKPTHHNPRDCLA